MTAISDISPKRGERAVIIGFSGSGKSNLAKALLISIRQPVIVIDPKREWDSTGYLVVNRVRHIPKLIGNRKVLFQPIIAEFDDVNVYNHVYKQIFETGNVCVYTDEVSVFSTGIRYPAYFKAIYHQGRSKNITAISSTQRPSAIPPFVITEVQRLYAFHLNSPDDVKKVRSMVKGYDPDKLKRYAFYYLNILGATREGKIMKMEGPL